MQLCRRAGYDRRRSASDRRRAPRPASPETAGETTPREPPRSKNSSSGRRSTSIDRATGPHPARSCGHAGGGTHAQNTLSTETIEVQVYYPFHPLHGLTVQIQRRPKHGDGAAIVADRAGKRLKIPMWMLSPSSREIRLSERAVLSKEALLSLF